MGGEYDSKSQLPGLVCPHGHTNMLSIYELIHLGSAYDENSMYSEGQFPSALHFQPLNGHPGGFTFKFFHFFLHHS